jgi:hypothetical protein
MRKQLEAAAAAARRALKLHPDVPELHLQLAMVRAPRPRGYGAGQKKARRCGAWSGRRPR